MKAAPWLTVLALTACVGVMPPAPSARGAACGDEEEVIDTAERDADQLRKALNKV